MGFKIDTVQVDNGYEFVNDIDKTGETSLFESVALSLGMKISKKSISQSITYVLTTKGILPYFFR